MAASEQDEIEKIMSEIEELQKDIDPPKATTATEEDILKEIQAASSGMGSSDEPGLEETLADIKSEVVSGGALDHEEAVTEEVVEEPVTRTVTKRTAPAVVAASYDSAETDEVDQAVGSRQASDGTLSLTLTGNMALKLKYEYEGQDVIISFVDQTLCVQMTDGTEFRVPVGRNVAPKNNVKPFKKAV